MASAETNPSSRRSGKKTELSRVQHPLVDHGSRREARDIEVAPARKRGTRHSFFDEPPNHVELALEGVAKNRSPLSPADEDLPDDRLAASGRSPRAKSCPWGHPAIRELAGLPGRDLLHFSLTRLAALGIDRQEQHPDTVVTGCRQFQTGAFRAGCQEGVRDLR